jgi:hypothetical protein
MLAAMLNPEQRRGEARDLASLWSRISRQHLSAGQGCSCGFGGMMLQASDFELDIVEFVINDARKAGLSGVEVFIDSVAKRGADQYSLPALLDAIAKDSPLQPGGEEVDFALGRLRTTLTSIEDAHNSARFVCD